MCDGRSGRLGLVVATFCMMFLGGAAHASDKDVLLRCAIASLKGYCVGYTSGLLRGDPGKLSSSDRMILEDNQTRLKSGITTGEQDDFSTSIEVSRDAGLNDAHNKLFESGQKGAFDEYNKLCIDGDREERKSKIAVFEFACTALH